MDTITRVIVQGHRREASCLNVSVHRRSFPEHVTPSSSNMQLLDLALSVHLSSVLSPALLLSEFKWSDFALCHLSSQFSITAHSFWLRCEFCGQNVSRKDFLRTSSKHPCRSGKHSAANSLCPCSLVLQATSPALAKAHYQEISWIRMEASSRRHISLTLPIVLLNSVESPGVALMSFLDT